jgi:AcrR family transcriptional regulator
VRRTKEDAALTREQLLNAAQSVFLAKGYVRSTLEDIAQQAGITRGAIHWHFGNKAELFNTLIRERYERAWIRMQDAYTEEATALQTLRHIIVRWLGYPEEDADFRAILELTSFKIEAVTELADGIAEKSQSTQATLNYFAHLIQQAITAKEVRAEVQPEVAARMALSLIYGVSALWLTDTSAFSLKACAEEMTDFFIRGIATN